MDSPFGWLCGCCFWIRVHDPGNRWAARASASLSHHDLIMLLTKIHPSLRTLLSLRTCGRAYCTCEEASQKAHLCNNNCADPAHARRRVSSHPFLTEYWQSRCLCRQPPSFSYRSADGSSAHYLLWYFSSTVLLE